MASRTHTAQAAFYALFFCDERCAFDSVGLTLTLADIYRNVRFDEPAEA